MAVGEIVDHTERSIGKPQGYRRVVGALRAARQAEARHVERDDRRAREMPYQIDEMAGFARDPPAAHDGILRPMIVGNVARIDRHDEAHGLAHAREQRFHPHRHGRETPVVAHHQQRRGRPLQFRLDRTQVLEGEAQRLFDEHILSSPQCPANIVRVGIVAGGNAHRIDGGIGQDRIGIARGPVEIELAAIVGRRHAARRHDGVEPGSGPLESSDQDAAAIGASTDKAGDGLARRPFLPG